MVAWRIVKQPNGLLARFSDIVDNFTELNMTEPEAVELCSKVYDLSMPDAMRKVLAGVEDWKPWTIGERGDGLSRWRDSLEKIQTVHGDEASQKVLQAVEDHIGY